ncbi:SIR2 family protein [Rhizobium sp. AN80A]|uniref:SIR2 family NAD-dependent protein deacylase n=1 Tax=Rhizobium sp. AN80A TaxID=3040673 RepID=UPI0024B36A48|nr:SIR2 family protein [Rhizobium sp. AN80A]
MSEYFEIGYAAVTNRLCFFTGTGFSKAVTNDAAPSWRSLLESLCDLCTDAAALRANLFPAAGVPPLSLEEAAQVIAIELLKVGKSIHDEVATLIKPLVPAGSYGSIQKFLSEMSYRVITTNYDKLIEQLAGDKDCQSLTPGLPIPRSSSRVKVYHVHGSTDSPENMVVTSDDYFKFLNSETYFSRKLSTILHENTVVILGYSLGDTNLKAIISDYKGFSRNHVIGSNIFMVSRSHVNRHIKDYYAHCYGIRVLDETSVQDFFTKLNLSLPEAERCKVSSVDNIRKVIFENHSFTAAYLGLENSFYEIVASLSAIGLSINHVRVVSTLGSVIEQKRVLTTQYNAWPQYEQLARWLIHLASILELRGTPIEATFLAAVHRSMTTMRKEMYTGYSWHAYRSWDAGWDGIIASNRMLIKNHIEANTTWPDALSVVQLG